jgi:hypothetical protein
LRVPRPPGPVRGVGREDRRRELRPAKRELALYWGAATSASQFFANRVTVVLDEQGRWRLFYSSSAIGFDMYGHPGVVLEDVKALLSCTP